MRICGKCKEEKSLDSFDFKNQSANIRSSYCKSCRTAYNKKHYRANKLYHLTKAKRNAIKSRDRVWTLKEEYLSCHSCIDCGESDSVVLEFDHVRGKKEFNIGDAVRVGYGVDRVRREIAKCEVRCANCHRRKTAKRWERRKSQNLA